MVFGAFGRATGKSQWRPLGFGGKALLLSIGFFGRLLLACYWVLEETDYVTMYYQVTTSLEQLVIAWAFPTKS